jgi:tetratricopeptide (TPR) repeat protein
VQDYVDEVLVLDSGMLNGAGEWAVHRGARLIPYQWTGNLSEARTRVARAATSEWVLMMDAGETLAPGAGEIIREAIDLGGLDCGFLPIALSDQALDSDEIERHPRLLRRTIDLRWDEGDTESVSGWITLRARRVKTVDATIIRDAEPSTTDTSNDDTIRDAEASMTDTTEDDTAVTEETPVTPSVAAQAASVDLDMDRIPDPALATAALTDVIAQAWDRYHDDDLDGSRAAAAAAWARMDGDSEGILSMLTLRAHIQMLDGDLKSALQTLDQGWQWGMDHPNLYMLQGVAAETAAATADTGSSQRQLLELAATAFTKCVEHNGELSARDALPGVSTWAAQTRLGSVRLAQGMNEEAGHAFDAALAADPEHAEATLGKFEVLLNDGQPAAIVDGLLPFMEADIADSWMLAAAACEELGRVEDALLFVGRANELVGQGMVVSKHRLTRMQDLLSMASVYVGHPVAGPGPWGTLGAILSRAPIPDDASVRIVDNAKTVRLVNHFMCAGWIDMIEALLERRAEQLAPGVAEAVRATLQAQGFDVTDDDEPEPVFMGGAWDSGISAIQGLLDAHHHIQAGAEVKLVPIILSLKNEWWQDMGPDLEAAGVGPSELTAAVKAFIHQLIGAPKSADKRVVDSTPHSLLHMGDLGVMFPRARFIHVVRDGRSVVSSLTRREWMDPATGEKVWCCQSVHAAAKYWSHVVSAIREQAELVPGRYLEVHYEELLADPRATLEKVMAFLGESWDPAMLDMELAPRETPERLTGVDHATFIREAGPALRAFGYTGSGASEPEVTGDEAVHPAK